MFLQRVIYFSKNQEREIRNTFEIIARKSCIQILEKEKKKNLKIR